MYASDNSHHPTKHTTRPHKHDIKDTDCQEQKWCPSSYGTGKYPLPDITV